MKYLDIRLHRQQWPLETQLGRVVPGLELVYETKAMRIFAIPANIPRRLRALLGEFCEIAEYEAATLGEEKS